MLYAIVIITLCGIVNVLAEDVYTPFIAKREYSVSSTMRQWAAFKRNTTSPDTTEVAICRYASPHALFLGTATQLRQFTVRGIESIVDMSYCDGQWICIGLKGDSLFVTLPSFSSQVPLYLCSGVRADDVKVSSINSSATLIETANQLFIANYTSDLSIQRIDKRAQRGISYSLLNDSIVIAGYSVSNNLVSYEYLNQQGVVSIGVMSNSEALSATSNTAIYSLTASDGHYAISSIDLRSSNSKPEQWSLPEGFFEPLTIDATKDTITVVFKNGFVVCDAKGKLLCIERSLIDAQRTNLLFERKDNHILIASEYVAMLYVLNRNDSYVTSTLFDYAYKYGVPFVIIVGLLYLLLRMLRYRRYFSAAIEYGSNSIAFVLDRNMKLRRINAKGRELFSMDMTTPLRRVLRFYCNDDRQRIVESFCASIVSSRVEQSQKLTLKSAAGEREIIFNGVPLRSLTGFFDGVLVTGVDITDELEKKRLVNWAQLAHDMQTNLSIIKLNAEQLKLSVPSTQEDKYKRIQHQAELLLHRVRDIVSIGRDEQLHAVPCDVTTMFMEIVNEFDDPSFAHVRFIISDKSCVALIDSKKMIRALRNAVENGIRALQGDAGTIELMAQLSGGTLRISVRDSGIGMDSHTAENFLKPYFSNYRQYGGTGIGTMIMLRAAEIHGGTIEVESLPSHGTTIHFIIPQRTNARR